MNLNILVPVRTAKSKEKETPSNLSPSFRTLPSFFDSSSVLAREMSDVQGAITYSLRNHLAGHVTRAALLCFEGVLSSFVKDRVKRQFPDVESEEELGEKAFQAKLLELEKKVADLSLQIKQAKGTQQLQGGTMKAMGARKKAAAAELRGHQRKKPCTKPKKTERYILECRLLGLWCTCTSVMYALSHACRCVFVCLFVYLLSSFCCPIYLSIIICLSTSVIHLLHAYLPIYPSIMVIRKMRGEGKGESLSSFGHLSFIPLS
jgi:hypothetical protein